MASSLMLPPAPRRPSVGRANAKKASSHHPHIAVGARVEALWQGTYYGAQVTGVIGTNSAHVLFDDGHQSTVAVSEIRAARLLQGTSVELHVANQDWVAGKVRPCTCAPPRLVSLHRTVAADRALRCCCRCCCSGRTHPPRWELRRRAAHRRDP